MAGGWAADAVPSVQSLDRAQAEQERLRKMLESKPKAYEDKVMDATPLPPAPEPATPSAAEAGLRTYLSESRLGWARSESGLDLRQSTELGQRLEYRQETLNYGDILLQADLRAHDGTDLGFGALGRAGQRTSGRVTLRNVGLPVTTQMFADSVVGDFGSEITDALARTYRMSLGTSTVRGAATRVFTATSDLRVGVGERGVLAGGPYPGFEKSQGSIAWAGYSQRFGERMFAGVQASRATEVPSITPGLSVARADVGSVAASIGYGPDLLEDGQARARAIHVRSETQGDDRPGAQGLFLEGATRQGTARHEFGVYQADPFLRFGEYVLASDTRGAYWRIDDTGLRLNWGAGVDFQEQNAERDAARGYRRTINASANAQYRIDRDRLVGGSATVLNSRHETAVGTSSLLQGGSRSLYANAFYQTRFIGYGRTRVRVAVHRNESVVSGDLPASGEELEWEQEWLAGDYQTGRPELSTTLGVARDRSSGVSTLSPTAGLNFRMWPAVAWTVSGNLRYTATDSHLATSRGLSGTLDTERQLPEGWVVGASVSLNQAVVEVAPTGLAAPTVTRSNDKYASVYLRWEGSRGSSYRTAGSTSVGAGEIAGVVFFDANRDGEQQGAESGVPNVEVLLDGRMRTTTDRAGRFVFPLVGTGHHQITLTLETVPLPWGAASDRATRVDVPLRGQAEARIPVVRVGD
nr:SdrD B-like domain-containing protein [Ramlibacter cellulosilyticus]